MTEADGDELIDQLARKAAEGCCMDDRWRGRTCSYHQGYVDGLDRMLMEIRSRHDPES